MFTLHEGAAWPSSAKAKLQRASPSRDHQEYICNDKDIIRVSYSLRLSYIKTAMSGPSTASVRRVVLTGSIAAITAVGTWYGAGLKTEQERKQVSLDASIKTLWLVLITEQVKQATLEAAATDQLAQMEALRGQLVHRRDELQAKIDQLTTKTVPTNLPPRGR
jgi:hypothetical protein